MGGITMTKGIILFQSKYGATKRYADCLIEETGFDLIETKKAKIDNLIGYDTIILGGGIYASNIAGIDFLRKNINSFKGKKILYFVLEHRHMMINPLKKFIIEILKILYQILNVFIVVDLGMKKL